MADERITGVIGLPVDTTPAQSDVKPVEIDDTPPLTAEECVQLMVSIERLFPEVAKAFVMSYLRNLIRTKRSDYHQLIQLIERMV